MSDAPGLDTTAFPELDDDQIAFLAGLATRRRVAAGEVLFSPDDASYDFVVIVSGSVQILAGHGASQTVVAVHTARRFLGEVSLLTRQRPYLTARVLDDAEIIVVPADVFRSQVVSDARVSDVILEAFLARRTALLASAADTLQIVGSRYSPGSLALREYAARNRLPHRWIDADSDTDVATLLEHLDVTEADLPLAITEQGIIRQATAGRLAQELGLTVDALPDRCYDLVVVGAGPGGLAASVYGASEGLTTLTVDAVAVGGQAGTSSRIENYLGFPTGISGADLAHRAAVQAQKFGARLTSPCAVTGVSEKAGHLVLQLGDDTAVAGRAVIAATGAHYRRLPVGGLSDHEGTSVFYAATELEARMCGGQPVVVVGGGNSAGQAAVFLASRSCDVHIVIRRPDLAATMSSYLIDRIDADPHIHLHGHSEITALDGAHALDGTARLDRVTVTSGDGDTVVPCAALFSFIGAEPNSGWLGDVALDDAGFVRTDRSLDDADLGDEWTGYGRGPLPFETSRPGLFAIGDLRSGSLKRVAAAVGEGSAAVRSVHEHLRLSH